MVETSFDELRKVHLQEKHASTLLQLGEDFFDVYLNYINEFYSELKGDFSMQDAKAYESCRQVFLELVHLRCQKVILKAFKDSRTSTVSTDGLAQQEKELYLSMLRAFSNYEESLSFSKRAPEAKQVPPTVVDQVKVEVLVDVPQFVSANGTLGPFTAGIQVELDSETASLLTGKGAAKRV